VGETEFEHWRDSIEIPNRISRLHKL
jgi:hypothetical protein